MSDAAFKSACEMEQAGDIEAAIRTYQMILANVDDARAAVNLGTIHYTRKEYPRAVELYRQAVKFAPDYALAHFNLGNALEETRNRAGAVKSYRQALKLNPAYSDAHYNLAHALEVMGEKRKAIKHWRAYVKLDAAGPWADKARQQMRRTIKETGLQIVWRKAA